MYEDENQMFIKHMKIINPIQEVKPTSATVLVLLLDPVPNHSTNPLLLLARVSITVPTLEPVPVSILVLVMNPAIVPTLALTLTLVPISDFILVPMLVPVKDLKTNP